LHDVHWSALYREPMTRAVASSSSNRRRCLWCGPSRQARFASAIMEQKGALHIPPQRVFSQTVSGLPKTDVLADLAAAAAPSARKAGLCTRCVHS
jgi:hypothetical protein